MPRIDWNDNRLVKLAQKTLRSSATIEDACSTLHGLGIDVTPNALDGAFRRRGMSSPGSFCSGVAAPQKTKAVDFVALHSERTKSKAEKKLLEHQVERLRQLEEEHDALSRIHATPAPPITLGEHHSSDKRECAAVALLSDVHYGEIIERSRSTFGNRYNQAIAEYRLMRFFSGLEWLIRCNRTWAEINNLVLWFGGDLINGQIHQEHFETSQSPIDSIIELQPILIAGIRRLLELDLKITLPCSYGNHGRTTEKKQISTGARHSYEYLMYTTIASIVRGDGVVPVVTPEAHQYVEVYGKTLHFTHGDDTKYNGGVGGISIALNKATDAWHRVNPAYLSHYGHYHQLTDNAKWLVNGSVCGFNAYAMSIKAQPEPPQQWFYILDSLRGRSTRSPVWVSDQEEEDRIK